MAARKPVPPRRRYWHISTDLGAPATTATQPTNGTQKTAAAQDGATLFRAGNQLTAGRREGGWDVSRRKIIHTTRISNWSCSVARRSLDLLQQLHGLRHQQPASIPFCASSSTTTEASVSRSQQQWGKKNTVTVLRHYCTTQQPLRLWSYGLTTLYKSDYYCYYYYFFFLIIFFILLLLL